MEDKESISDYNQEDMEKLIPYSIIFNYENEWIEKINKASLETAYQLADSLGCAIEELIENKYLK